MRIGREHHIHSMSSLVPPIATVEPGAVVTVETMDALDGSVVTVEGEPVQAGPEREARPWRANPATGPLFISGVEPGDGVAVHIRDIRPVGTGHQSVCKGALGGKIGEPLRRLFRPEAGFVQFSAGIRLPLDPMIGVIGVAPKEGEVPTTHPGDHGGNMDTALVKKGATVYLSAHHEGGLLSLGDIHLLMGDGEVNGQGIEAYAEVDLQVDVIHGWRERRPLVETGELWATIASHENLERACWLACADMVDFLVERAGVTPPEAALLIGLVGQVRVSQIVNPLRTARVEMPKTVFE